MNKAHALIRPGLAIMLALTVMITGCTKQAGGGETVATVDGTVITKADYDKTYNEFTKTLNLASMPEQQRTMLTETIKQMAVNKLILSALINNEANKAGIQVTGDEIQKYKQEKIFSNPDMKTQFKTFLEQNQMSEADFDAMLKENLLMNKFLDVKGGPAVQVSDSEVKMFYEKNAEQFKVPERIRAKHILVEAVIPKMKKDLREKNDKISDEELDKQISAKRQELKAKAEKLFAEVKSHPEKFEELAKTNSDDTVSAKQGGDLGFMAKANIDPTFWAAVEKTPNGKFYPSVVDTPFGYHIIQVIERQAPHKESFAEALPMIKEHLSQQKKQAFLQKWNEQKQSQAQIVIEPKYMPKQPAPMESAPAAAGAAGQAQPAGAPQQGKH